MATRMIEALIGVGVPLPYKVQAKIDALTNEVKMVKRREKAPAFQFYVRDWLSDVQLRAASFQTRGLWVDILCFAWLAPERGKITGTQDELLRMLGCAESEFLQFANEAEKLKFCDILRKSNGDSTQFYAITNRRMYREWKDNENAKLRAKRAYKKSAKKQDSTQFYGDSTVLSASASASALKEREKKAASKPPCPRLELLSLFNTICAKSGLPTAKEVDGQRAVHMGSLWAKHPDVEWWKSFFERVASSRFLTGDNDRAWRADLTWILKPANATKIIEGNYDGRGGGGGKQRSDALGILWANKHRFFQADREGRKALYRELLPGRPAPSINWQAIGGARDDFAAKEILKTQLEG